MADIVPGSPEHEEAMIAKVDAVSAKAIEDASPKPLVEPPVETSEEAPKEGEEKPVEGTEEAPKEEGKEDTDEAAKDAVEAAGVDYNSLQAEFDKEGQLSEESYTKLEKAGFPKEVVDAFIAGQEALAERVILKGYEAAGGKDQFSQMVEWAKNSLTKPELEAYNEAVQGGSEEQMLQAVRGLRSRFETEYGRQPNLLGGSNNNAGAQGYASRHEMTTDMRNPLYTKDPAFRAKVEAKIARTTAF